MKKSKAFTLIELLVVIAIISLLVSILLPSLNTAKELARRVACQSTMRSYLLATTIYASDNDEQWVPCQTSKWWYTTLQEGGYQEEIVACPSAPETAGGYKTFGYGYTVAIWSGGLWGGVTEANQNLYPARDAEPSTLLVIADSGLAANGAYGQLSLSPRYGWDAPAAMVAGYPNNTRSRLGDPHQEMTNGVFADGHVQVMDFWAYEPYDKWYLRWQRR